MLPNSEQNSQPPSPPSAGSPSAASSRTRRLIALNALLLAGLALAGAWAQPAISGRGRGDYAMLGGKTNAGSWQAVYIVDGRNDEMIVLRWDSSRSQAVGLGYRDLRSDSAAQPGR